MRTYTREPISKVSTLEYYLHQVTIELLALTYAHNPYHI